MKSLKNLWKLFSLSALLMLAACSADDLFDLGDDTWSRQNLSPAITEAREFFEDRITEADLNGTLDLESFLAPGEVSPVWKNATIAQEGSETRIWIPIESDYSYIVRTIVVFKNGEAAFRTWPVRQVLLISKDELSGSMSASYVTLVPTRDYHMKHRSNVLRNFTQKENYGGYSGLAIYYDAATMKPSQAEKYLQGDCKLSFNKEEFKSEQEFYRYFRSPLLPYDFFRAMRTKTQGDGEVFIDGLYDSSMVCPEYYDGLTAWQDYTQSDPVSNHMLYLSVQESYTQWGGGQSNSTAFHNYPSQLFPESSCVFNNVAFICNVYGGTSSESQIIASHLDPDTNSVQIDITSLVNEYLQVQEIVSKEEPCTKPMMDYDQHLSAGHLILTNVWEKHPNEQIVFHEVTIIGKCTMPNDGSVRYVCRDSSDGKLYDAPRDVFGSDIEIAVSGLKTND